MKNRANKEKKANKIKALNEFHLFNFSLCNLGLIVEFHKISDTDLLLLQLQGMNSSRLI